MMKRVSYILAFVWMALAILMGTTALTQVPKQMQKDKAFLETVMRPPVEFVKDFKLIHGYLPDSTEFNKWLTQHDGNSVYGGILYMRSANGVAAEDISKFRNVDWKKDFAVGIWCGEWEEYYFSWSDKYDVNNYSWRDGVIEFIICLFIGILPLVIVQLIENWKNHEYLQS